MLKFQSSTLYIKYISLIGELKNSIAVLLNITMIYPYIYKSYKYTYLNRSIDDRTAISSSTNHIVNNTKIIKTRLSIYTTAIVRWQHWFRFHLPENLPIQKIPI